MSARCVPRAMRGFTLLETMIVSVLLTLIGGTALVLGGAGRDVWVTTDAAMASQTNARAALAKLSQELRAGSRKTLACPPGVPITGDWSLSVKLDRPGIDKTPGIIDFEEDEIVTYKFEAAGSGQLTRDSTLDLQRVLISGLSGSQLVACDKVNGRVEVVLTARVNSTRGPEDSTLRSNVFLRNP
jgi:type II secretory pathway pseudopilin PulG